MVPPSLTSNALADKVLGSRASLKPMTKSTLLRLVWPLACTTLARSMEVMRAGVLSIT